MGRTLTIGAILVPLGILAVGFAAWVVATEQLQARLHSVGPLPRDLDGYAVSFNSESGSRIAGWLVPGRRNAGIVLLHGSDADRRSMTGRARLLHGAGYSILAIDFQANGESPGERMTYGYLESFDAHAAVEFLRAELALQKIGIVGFSLGGAAALLGPLGPLAVDAAVLEAVYPTIEEAIANRIRMRLGSYSGWLYRIFTWQLRHRLGIEPAELRPIDRIAALDSPVLFIAGEDDPQTTLAQSMRLVDAANNPKRLWVVTSAGHEDFHAHSPEAYASQVLDFFSEFL